MRLQIVKLDENRPKLIVAISLLLMIGCVLLYKFDIINSTIFGLLFTFGFFAMIAIIRISKRLIKIGEIKFKDENIEILYKDKSLIYDYSSLIRLRLKYKGFEDEISTTNFMYYGVSNGLNKILIIGKDNIESEYTVLIKDFNSFRFLRDYLVNLNKRYSNLIEITKE